MARITINGVSVDPVAQSAGLRAAALESADASQSNYILIQTDGPLTDDQKAQLSDLGVEIHEYVPENTYVCGYRASDLSAIRALPFVVWADVYLRAFKIPPALRPAAPDATASVLPASVPRSPSRVPRQVDVVLHDDVSTDSDQLRREIAAVTRRDPDDLQVAPHKVRLSVEQGQLDALADLDEVHHVEEVPRRQLFNNVARPILNADVVVNGTPYQGSGQTVAVADTGFDRGAIANAHPAFSGRVLKLYALGRRNPDRANDPHGHGTHVAGSVLGDGVSTTMGGAIQGTAPRASLVLQSLLDRRGGLGGIPIDLHDLFQPPYDADGARVHTNSWGSTVPGLPYDASSREIDDFVWNHPDMVICFAAGNSGADGNNNGVVDAGSIGSEAAAKNCITIGASESSRPRFTPTYGRYWPSDFPADPINSDVQADNPDGLVAFSSRGPTRESRIKPDVVAPGTCILSTLSRDVAGASTDFGVSTDPLFFFDSGTSMATPLVAGCVAVLRETLVGNGIADPSAALVKALLVNGAVELSGQYSPSEAGASPNNNSGFGRVDLAGSVIIPGTDPDAGLGEGEPLNQGDEASFVIEIPERSPAAVGTLKVTLVWSDPPGAALQNDLDLIVRAADGQERHGNMGTSANFDRQNNVEKVVWFGVPPGEAEIVVRAFRITNFPQPYAYAWRIS
jgi:serine protease AprX